MLFTPSDASLVLSSSLDHSLLFCICTVSCTTMTSSSSSRPLTRSQASMSVLGKRTTRTLTRSASVSSCASSTPLPTPESTPKTKRVRTSLEESDPRSNKENIPPFHDEEPESPTTSRLRRRASVSSVTSTMSSEHSTTSEYPLILLYSSSVTRC